MSYATWWDILPLAVEWFFPQVCNGSVSHFGCVSFSYNRYISAKKIYFYLILEFC